MKKRILSILKVRKIIEKMKFLVLGVCLFYITSLEAQPQKAAVSIKASATVEEYHEMELITIHDMQVDQASAENGYITISPKLDAEAGKMIIKGTPNNKIRITYFNNMSLSNALGKGQLDFTYVVSGYPGNNQNASMILDSTDPIITFNENGEYYIWVGGKVNIKNAIPGNYLGKFTLQLENL